MCFVVFRYIETMQSGHTEVSNWRRQLTASEQNTPLPAHGAAATAKLPLEWLGEQSAAHHGSTLSAIWALRDLMMKDALSLSRTIDYGEVRTYILLSKRVLYVHLFAVGCTF